MPQSSTVDGLSIEALAERIRQTIRLNEARIPITYDEQCQLFDDMKQYREMTGGAYVELNPAGNKR